MNIPKSVTKLISNNSHLHFLIIYGIIGFLLILPLAHMPISVDYKFYITNTRAVLSGDTRLYDANSDSFYYLPWSLLLTAPLSFLPDHLGQSFLCIISTFGIFLSLHILTDKVSYFGIFLVACNLYTVNMIASCQWDGISLGTCAMAWWCIKYNHYKTFGLMMTLITSKPTNTFIVLLLIGIYAVRHWQFGEIKKASLMPIILLGASFVVCGIDWPWRYLTFLYASPPPQIYNLSLWTKFSILAIPAIAALIGFLAIIAKYKMEGKTLAIGMVMNLLISPYVLSYHFVNASPALSWMAHKHPLFALFPWLVMVYQLACIAVPHPTNYLLYPIAIASMSICVCFFCHGFRIKRFDF